MPHLADISTPFVGLPVRVNPLFAHGCKVLISPDVAGGLLNLVDGTALTWSSTAQPLRATQRGAGLGLPGGGTYAAYKQVSTNAPAFTVLIDLYSTESSLTRGFFQYATTSASSGGPQLLLQNNGGDLRAYWSNGYRITGSGLLPNPTQAGVVARWDGTSIHLYCNGPLIGSYTGAAAQTGSHIWFGNGFSASINGAISVGAWWESDIGDGAARALSRDPTLVFEPEPITIYWPAATGGAVTHATTGAVSGGGSLIDGAAARTRLHAANGDLYGLGATLGGSAARLALHITSGVLIGSSAILDGIAARTRAHPASGDLIGGGAIITGDLIRSEIPEHFTSGAILGDGASVSGSAARFRAFDTSGDIVGAGAVVDGAADKTGPAEHAASGSFVGGGSAVDGQANRYRALGTSGDIEGDGAAVVGIAAIIRSHDTSGSLFGDGALITSVVIRGGQVELLYVAVTARAAFACVVSARGAYSCTVSEAIAR